MLQTQHFTPQWHRSPSLGCGRQAAGHKTRCKFAKPCQAALDYKAAGVDIDAGNELVRRIKKMNPSIGGFSGMVPFGDSFLVAGTDGVGTKLKLAFELGKHDTIGIDLVAMSVNDIITSGAKPLFFLDYYATGRLDVDVAEAVVKGIVEGCRQSDCILLGGETAEMPGFYQPGEYDVAGFAVGAVKQTKLIDGSRIKPGDVLLGLPSSGIHSNGFSLVRKVIERAGVKLDSQVAWDADLTFGEAMLTPTTIYVKQLGQASQLGVKGLVHITGGGFPENIPRVFPNGVGCKIDRSSWQIPDLFQWVQQEGGIADAEMFRTFNMGIGMVIIVPPEDTDKAMHLLADCVRLGEITEGSGVDLQL
ncbi:hypothetical protein WJX74_009533 [Apatococcus lobatus]|uniref:Phosphoribosylformylglycinamidine cyclo-ligase n=1 Tax=Apatococcus lobatus TaxID=904363 RepID=A0AAW1SH80_9CHLO